MTELGQVSREGALDRRHWTQHVWGKTLAGWAERHAITVTTGTNTIAQ